jgi:NAD(P)-dependent dehydrogenase (short-subunit alcohol dehydrogenase family)
MIETTIRTNALGALYMTQAFLPLLQAGGQGHKYLERSAGRYAMVFLLDAGLLYEQNLLNAITPQLASALAGRSVAVNAVCPRGVQTDMGGRGGTSPVTKVQKHQSGWLPKAPLEVSGKFSGIKKKFPGSRNVNRQLRYFQV